VRRDHLGAAREAQASRGHVAMNRILKMYIGRM
jgi:hypothetical protein